MQIKGKFKLNQVCNDRFLVPMGEENVDFSKLVALNESSVLLWQRMEQGEFTIEDLVEVILSEYEIDEESARRDIMDIISKFKEEGMIIDEDTPQDNKKKTINIA